MLSQVVINQGNFALQNRAENVVQTVVHCFSIMLSNKLIINRIIPLSQSPLGSLIKDGNRRKSLITSSYRGFLVSTHLPFLRRIQQLSQANSVE